MNNVYHWIGLIVFWAIIIIVSLWCLMFVGNIIWQALKEGFRRTWIWDWWDYTRTAKNIFNNPEECAKIDAQKLWNYVRSLKYSKTFKHRYKDKILAEVDRVLELYPKLKVDYLLNKKADLTGYKAAYIGKRGWTEDKEAKVKDVSAWYPPKDKEGYDGIVVMHIYDAYRFEQDKVKAEQAEQED